MSSVLQLLLPCPCVVCGAARGPVCRPCAGQQWLPQRRDPRPRPLGLPPVWAAAAYEGEMQRLVLAYKQDGCWPALRPLVRALVGTLLAATATEFEPGGQPVLIVPVPTSAAARRRRGHHHVLTLCRRAGRDRLVRSAGFMTASFLHLHRVVVDQRGLAATDRRRNLAGSMTCRTVPSRLTGLPCVVVDDVVTTGSTAAEAVRALTVGGLRVLAVVALAATRRQIDVPRFPKTLATADDRG